MWDAPERRPAAALSMLRARAELYRGIRDYMRERNVLEVETPILSRYADPEPRIMPLLTRATTPERAADRYYLRTSPESAMKQLLAAGSGAVYQLGKVFRDEEQGPRHRAEFTMLEWYRLGLDHHELMEEMNDLLARLGLPAAVKTAYADCFATRAGLDPHTCDTAALRAACRRHGFDCPADPGGEDRGMLLDFLFSHLVAPALGRRGPEFVYDYPACQASLARVSDAEPPVAERFELFVDGLELANGFHELTDAAEQARRFERDNRVRAQSGRPLLPIDKPFLRALAHGLPDCAGVALGLDRLLMILTGAADIEQVIGFNAEGAASIPFCRDGAAANRARQACPA